jgi:hypothetical protein
VSERSYGGENREGTHHAYLILGQGKKKRSTVSVIGSSKAAHIIPEFQGRMELENPGKARNY